MRGVVGSVSFLFIGPMIVVFLFFVNLFSSPGEWWVVWPALGIGLAWFINLFKLVRTLLVMGGLAGLVALLNRR